VRDHPAPLATTRPSSAREAFPPDSLVTREGVARVIETMRTFGAVPTGMPIAPESLFGNRLVQKASGH